MPAVVSSAGHARVLEGRAQAGTGQTGPAISTLQVAIGGWTGADESSPELANLTSLAGTLS